MLSTGYQSLSQLTMRAHGRQPFIEQYDAGHAILPDVPSMHDPQPLLKIHGPSTRLLRAFPIGPIQLQRQPYDHRIWSLSLDDVDHVIQRAKGIPIRLNVADGVCKRKLGVG